MKLNLDQFFSSIEKESRTHVDTACAAHWLNRQPQTMRMWACLENGPIRPIRIHGRLAWSVADIKRLLANGTTSPGETNIQHSHHKVAA